MLDGNPNKFFAKVGNVGKVDPTIGYIWDPNAIVSGNPTQTGAFRPAQTSDFAANISVSGLNLTVGAVQVTGGYIGITGTPNVNIVNSVLNVTGLVTAQLTGVVPVNITNTQPLAVSGNLVSTVPTYTNVSSTGFVSGFAPFSGPQYVKGILVYSQCALGQGFGGFLQIYDGSRFVATISVQSGQNSFQDYAENGCLFNNFNIINSSNPISNQQYGTGDFFVTVIYR